MTPQRQRLADRGNDLYETPAGATQAFLAHVALPRRIWEPACGPGAIVRELRAAGRDVVATDLVDYGERACAGSASGRDFLMEFSAPPGVDAIVTNPPYKLATECVTHALSLRVPLVAMLLRLTFIESERRSAILARGKLARLLVFINRLPTMQLLDWALQKTPNVQLRKDYFPHGHDATILMRRG